MALPFAQAALSQRAGWNPVGDVALIGIRSRDAVSSPTLIGQPTSADALGADRESAHIGPIEAFLFAPGVIVFGSRAGLVWGTAAVNSLALGASLLLGFRRGGAVLFALIAAGLALYVRGLDPSVLHDPINSDIATIWLVVLVLAAWSMWCEDLRMAPVLAFASAFVLQPHIANASVALVATAAGTWGIAVVMWRRRSRRPVRADPDLPWVIAAGAVTALAWLPPVLAEITEPASNISALWHSLRAPREHVGLRFSLGRASAAVGPWPLPSFARVPAAIAPSGYVSGAQMVFGLGLFGLAGSVAIWSHYQGRRAVGQLVALLLAMTAAAVYSTSVLPFGGLVRPEHSRWVGVVGMLLWCALAWAIWLGQPPTRRRRLAMPLTVALLAMSMAVLVSSLTGPLLRANGGDWAMSRVGSFTDAIRHRLPRGAYLMEPQGGAGLLTVGPAVVLRLDEGGYRTFVVERTLSRGYDQAHFYDGQPVRGTLWIQAADEAPAPHGARLIARQRPAPGAAGNGRKVLEAYLGPAP